MPLIYPERGTDHAYRRPLAYTASTDGTDGRALDAGTVILAQCEAAHLVHESCRLLASTLGPTPLGGPFADRQAVWADIEGVEAPTNWSGSEYPNVWQRIPWDRRTACRVPVTHAIEDRADAQGEARQRIIELRMQVYLAADVTDATAFFALTFSPSPRSIGDSTPLATASLTPGALQVASGTITLTDPAPSPTARMRARAESSLGAEVLTAPFWLWFGWRIIGPTPSSAWVHTLSAWERR